MRNFLFSSIVNAANYSISFFIFRFCIANKRIKRKFLKSSCKFDDSKSDSTNDSIEKRRIITASGSRVQDKKLGGIRKLRNRRKENGISDTEQKNRTAAKPTEQESRKQDLKVPTNMALHKLAKQGYSKLVHR